MQIQPVRRLSPHSLITDAQETHIYWMKLLSLWRLPRNIKHFPAANPVSIERKHLVTLEAEDYVCGLKTDGVRYVLLMTTKPNSHIPIAIMIDRARNMYEIEIWAHETFFTMGSLLDGELVWDHSKRESMAYIVFDAIVIRGEHCSNMVYTERLRQIRDTILYADPELDDRTVECAIIEEVKFAARNNDFDISIVPKRCVPKEHLRTLWERRMHENHNNDGIIFTCNCSGVDTGTSRFVYKWKPQHTVDVRVSYANDQWQVGVNSNTDDSILPIETIIERPVRLENNRLTQALQDRHMCIIECVVRIVDDTIVLIPERQRTDKNTANNVRTVLATILNVEENIIVEDIFKILERTGGDESKTVSPDGPA